MALIILPYGHAKFESEDLVAHIFQSGRNFIIKGGANCRRDDHQKPNSLDCWLRDNYARHPDTRQAVNEVIDDLVATGDFEEGIFKCPDSGRQCQGIKLTEKRLTKVKNKDQMNYKISIIVERDNNGYYAFSPELEGCQSQGDTLEEVLANIREAVELYVETMSKEEIETYLSKEILTTSVEVRVG